MTFDACVHPWDMPEDSLSSHPDHGTAPVSFVAPPLAAQPVAGPHVAVPAPLVTRRITHAAASSDESRQRRHEVRVRRVTGHQRDRGHLARRLSEQCRHALENGAAALAQEGAALSDVVRVVYMLRDADAFPACFPLLRDVFGDARPAVTLRLVDGFELPDMQIELELVARPAF
jgi:2-iminobutanoate/2-iminopropanoate deaminase